MERLLQPDLGLMVWTIVTFLGLVFVLKKVAWKPMLQALEDREAGIKRAIAEAQAAKASAETLKAQYEKELAEGQQKAQAILAQTTTDAQKIREQILKEAADEAQRLAANSRRQIEEEKDKVLRDIRKEVAGLSIAAAEKLVRHTMNAKVQDELLKEFFTDLDKQGTKGPLN
jgi:F-type H+-transporting ATPase subunit b